MGSAGDSPEAAAAFLREAARYFERRPTGGEDAAWWSNWANGRNCLEIAAMIEKMGAHIKSQAEK